MSRLFDPVNLLNAEIEANATRRDPLPMGEVVAYITEIGFSDGTVKKSGPNFGKPWNRLDCKLEITDPEYLAQIPGNPDKAVTNLGIMLDMENGAIKSGPNVNVRLGRLREATGTNGKPLSMMVGQPLRIQIMHKPHPTEEGVVLDEISNYTKV